MPHQVVIPHGIVDLGSQDETARVGSLERQGKKRTTMKVVSNNRGKDRVNDRGKDRGKGKGQEKGQEQAVALTETTVGPVNRATRAIASTPAVCGRCIIMRCCRRCLTQTVVVVVVVVDE